MTCRKILYLLRRPPDRSVNTIEALQSALVSAVFDQEVSILFRDSGVLQLAAEHGSQAPGRSLAAVLASLPEYGIGRLFVCRESILRFGTTPSGDAIPIQLLDRDEQAALIAAQDAVIND